MKQGRFSLLAFVPKNKAIALAIFSGSPAIEPLVSMHKIIGPSFSSSWLFCSTIISVGASR